MPISTVTNMIEFLSGLSIDVLVLINLVLVGIIIFICWVTYKYLLFFNDEINNLGKTVHREIDSIKLENASTKSFLEFIKKSGKYTPN